MAISLLHQLPMPHQHPHLHPHPQPQSPQPHRRFPGDTPSPQLQQQRTAARQHMLAAKAEAEADLRHAIVSCRQTGDGDALERALLRARGAQVDPHCVGTTGADGPCVFKVVVVVAVILFPLIVCRNIG